jgi:Flp pilus assembly pilin Flp
MITKLKNKLAKLTEQRLVTDERGLSTVEYIIVLCLIVVVGIGVWQLFGTAVTGRVTNATNQINTI